MVTSLSGSGERGNEAPRSKAARYLCEILRSPTTLLAYSAEAAASAAKAGRQGYGGFSSPSSSQQATRYSAKENKKARAGARGRTLRQRRPHRSPAYINPA